MFSAWRQVGLAERDPHAVRDGRPVTFTVWPVIIGVALLIAVLHARSSRDRCDCCSARCSAGWAGGSRGDSRSCSARRTAPAVLAAHHRRPGQRLLRRCQRDVLQPRRRDVAGHRAAACPPLRSGSPESLVAWDELGRQGRSFVATGPTVGAAQRVQRRRGDGAHPRLRRAEVRGHAAGAGRPAAGGAQAQRRVRARGARRSPRRPAPGSSTRTASTRSSTSSTATSRSPACSTPTCRAGSRCWPTSRRSRRRRASSSTRSTTTGRRCRRTHGPKLYLYGLSLGSYGVESVLNSINVINEPIAGAFMSGPPFVNDLHTEIVTSRDAGLARVAARSTPTAARCGSPRRRASRTPRDRGATTRVVYLQHGSDPVVFFSPEPGLGRRPTGSSRASGRRTCPSAWAGSRW